MQTLFLTADMEPWNPHISNGEVHLYAKRGAVPTPWDHDAAATRSSTDQLLVLPGLDGTDPHAPRQEDDWYVVVYAAAYRTD